MSLLALTANLYREFRRERPATDAAVLQLRDFLTNQFGHEGTRAYQEVDETTSTKQVEKPGAVTLRRFRHPLAVGRTAESVLPQETPVPNIETVQAEPPKEIVVDAGGVDDLGKPVILSESLPSESTKSPLPAADKEGPISLAEFVDMKPKVVAAKYDRDKLVETLKAYKVPFNAIGSNTQLAAALIQYANSNK